MAYKDLQVGLTVIRVKLQTEIVMTESLMNPGPEEGLITIGLI